MKSCVFAHEGGGGKGERGKGRRQYSLCNCGLKFINCVCACADLTSDLHQHFFHESLAATVAIRVWVTGWGLGLRLPNTVRNMPRNSMVFTGS